MTRGAGMRKLVNLFGLTLNEDEYPDVYFPDIEESEYFNDIMVATKYGFVDAEAGIILNRTRRLPVRRPLGR